MSVYGDVGSNDVRGETSPFLIFRGKRGGRIQREWTGKTEYPSGCSYEVQENGHGGVDDLGEEGVGSLLFW